MFLCCIEVVCALTLRKTFWHEQKPKLIWCRFLKPVPKIFNKKNVYANNCGAEKPSSAMSNLWPPIKLTPIIPENPSAGQTATRWTFLS
ncbi:hypothetical protein XELAEV_18017473mg [Xenopus laevis]|uniref:Uncharacterized protein n=1 Tax=Xenopus laevis TaxID=8355 RepID=A0A974DBN7_XENLA|nr:hypothetical protein XELAEV_18017473mg [Xenopus laevis]